MGIFLGKGQGPVRCDYRSFAPTQKNLKSRHLREGLSWAGSLPYKFVTENVALKAILHLEKAYVLQYLAGEPFRPESLRVFVTE